MSQMLHAMIAAQDSIDPAHRQAWKDNAAYTPVRIGVHGEGALYVCTYEASWIPLEAFKRNPYMLRTWQRDLSLPSGQTQE